MKRKTTNFKFFFHKSVNISKMINFWKNIFTNNIDKKAIIHKCTKFHFDIFKN